MSGKSYRGQLKSLLFWIWICTLQGPFLAIFAMQLGERNAKIKNKLLKKNSLCGSILQSLFQIFKNWLKRISALTAYVWGAAHCSALPTADVLVLHISSTN